MIRPFLTLAFAVLAFNIFAQRVTLVEGDILNLKNLKSVKTRFLYDNLIVGVDVPETDYVEKKKIAWDEKAAGQGDAWKEMWFGDRKKKYEPVFRHFFNIETNINAKDTASQVMLVFRTLRMEPGWSIGLVGSVAIIDADISFVDSSDPARVLARFKLENCKGEDYNGGDFEASRRLRQAYMNAGKLLGYYMKLQIKKRS
jgi:hypothetical protein